MTTQYTSILKLALPVQGELSGTWGDTVNDNITSMVEEAIAGRAVINSWTANSHTLTTANGTTSESRCAMLEFTDTGAALTGNATVVCPTASKIYIAKNAVGSSRTVTLKTSAGTGIAIPDGTTMFLFCDGTNVVEAVTNMNSFNIGGTVTIVAIKDEDDMSSDSATALATQQSIKAYVDSQIAATNELSEVLAAGNTSGGTAIQMTTTDEVQFRDTDLKISSSADGQLDIDADTELEITAPTVDINASTAVLVSNDLKLDSDDAVLGFGADNDVTVTHIPDAALRINDAIAVEFRDADLSINSSADGQLDIDADTEIEITAPTVDIDASTEVNISGATKVGGTLSVDTIAELTATAGVTVDDILIKDNTVGTPDSSGTDVAGTNVTVKGGAGTGTGAGGSLVFQTAPAGSTGSSVNAQVTALTIDSAGDATFTGAAANMSWDKSDNALEFADNAKAIFGAGSDLQIYHDASNSYVQDAGSGNLYLRSNGTAVVIDDGTNNLAAFNASSGESALYFGGSGKKLATTSTGIDVTGTAVTDGVTVSGNILLQVEGNELQFNTGSTPVNKIYSDDTYTSNGLTISADNGVALQSTNNYLLLDDTGTNEMVLNVDGGERLRVTSTGIDVTGSVVSDGLTVQSASSPQDATISSTATNGAARLVLSNDAQTYRLLVNGTSSDRFQIFDGTATAARFAIDTNGDISFYDSAGSSQSFFWDASAESLGIGTTTPDNKLHVVAGADGEVAQFTGAIETRGLSIYVETATDASALTRLRANSGGSAGQLAFNTDGNERMRIDSSGLVGIGETNPNANLHISTNNTSTTNTATIRLEDTDTTQLGNQGVGRIEFYGNDSSGAGAGVKASIEAFGEDSSGRTALKFSVASAVANDTERMRIDSSGNVGIGTTSPSAKLDTAYTDSATYSSTSPSADLILSRKNTDNTANETVGIRFDVTGWSGSTTGGAAIEAIQPSNASTADLAFLTRDAGTWGERMRIDSNGNVGIGTDSPSALLNLSSSSNTVLRLDDTNGTDSYHHIETSGTNGQNLIISADQGGTGGGALIIRNNGGSEAMRIDSDGNVGIGISPAKKLTVFGTGAGNATVQIEGEGGADPYINFLANNTQHWSLGVDDSDSDKFKLSEHSALGTNDYFVVDVTGNVGIGVTSPTRKLHVNDASNTIVGRFSSGQTSTWAQFASNSTGTAARIGSPTDDVVASIALMTRDTERMLIDADGNTTFKANNSAVGPIVTLENTASAVNGQAWGSIHFDSNDSSTGASGTRASIVGTSTSFNGDGNITFSTAPANGSNTERMRVDASGNLLVGKTSTGAAIAGIELNGANDLLRIARDGGVLQELNRITNDGAIIEFRKDNTAVGSIGTLLDGLYIGSPAGTDAYIGFTNSIVYPSTSTGVGRDDAIDFGTSDHRFKDLYLSGGAYLGGTGAANYLDDYEEGTWTPTLPNGGTLTVEGATYTKIGRLVNVRGYIQDITPTANTSQFQIGGLPFTTGNTAQSYGAGSISFSSVYDASGLGILNRVNGNSLYFHYIDGTSGSSLSNNNWISTINATSGQLIFQITYYT